MVCRWSLTTLAAVLSFNLWAAEAAAQPQPQGWNVEVSSGVTPTTGDISSRLTRGWNIGVGAGYEFNENLELEGIFTYNSLNVSSQVLQNLKVPDGTGRVMSLTIGPNVHFPMGRTARRSVAGAPPWL